MKKVIAFSLALALMFSYAAAAADTAAVIGVAEPSPIKSTTADLEKVILAVKAAIEIPEELTEFDYGMYGDNDEFYLNWFTSDNNKRLSVNYSKGNITNYYYYENQNEYGGYLKLAKLTRDEAASTARTFAAKLVKNEGDYKLKSSSVYDGQYSYYFNLNKNGVAVLGADYNVSVDYISGRIISFYQSAPLADSFIGDPSKTAVSAADAQELLKTVQKESLQYYINYDWENGKVKNTFPAYTVSYSDNYMVDASTGKLITAAKPDEGSYGGDDGMGGMEKAPTSASNKKDLSDKEAIAVKEYEGLITAEQAANLLYTQLPEQFTKELVLQSKNLNRDYYDKELINWSLYFNKAPEDSKIYEGGASATVNAKTGEITSFYTYSYSPYDASATAEKYSTDSDKIIAAGKAIIAKLNKSAEITFEVDPNFTVSSTDQYAYVYFNRMENGIQVSGNGISVTYDQKSGIVTSYNKNVTKAEFAKFTAAGRDAVLTEYAKQNPAGLCYVAIDGAYKLVYLTSNTNGAYMFDGITAKPINYDGSEFKPYDGSDIKYDDIDGHFAKSQILALANIGIGFPGGSFKPNDAITEKEFVNLLLQAKRSYYIPYYTAWDSKNTSMVYDAAKSSGIIKKDETVYPDSPATRARAAVLMVRLMGFDDVALLKDIYVQPFSDVTVDSEGYGAISIIKGMKIIGGDSGSYHPAKVLTKGEAAVMLYNLLAAKA